MSSSVASGGGDASSITTGGGSSVGGNPNSEQGGRLTQQHPTSPAAASNTANAAAADITNAASTVGASPPPPAAAAAQLFEPQNPFEVALDPSNVPTVPSLSLSGSGADGTSGGVALLRTPDRINTNNTPTSTTVTTPTSSSNSAATDSHQQHFVAFPGGSLHTDDDDDEDTAPSSAANTAGEQQQHYPYHLGGGSGSQRRFSDPNQHGGSSRQIQSRDFPHPAPTQSIRVVRNNNNNQENNIARRLIETTKRRLNNNRRDSEDLTPTATGVLIAGYLQKLGRNGKWQTRWFETDGECLSYYKNEKRSKLLATLDLQKVGLIEVDTDDEKECSFVIQVLGRLYHLRAESRASCKDWVITLNRVKEARLQQGNVKLVGNKPTRLDLLDSHRSDNTPRVVVVANRQRTRAVDAEEEQWDQLIREDPTDPEYVKQKRRSALGNAVVARWTKRHSSLQRLGTKLSKWARSLKKYSCADMEREKIYLDQHVHPPGHDDTERRDAKFLEKQQQQHQAFMDLPHHAMVAGGAGGHHHDDDWLMDKESTSSSSGSVNRQQPLPAAPHHHLPPQQQPPTSLPGSVDKPVTVKDRTLSTASDYDARMIS